ncbi:hypothetical protein [Chryseobacterium sp. IT-36CA2]|uniref:hypothetical protein n=1 Tax=Chryseobacterium sp. IT-36CA2 TaxID=3026460 RepID=UPI0039E1B8C9
MKYILIIIILTLTSCSSSKKIESRIEYKIVRIERLNSVYIIYAQNINTPIYETIKIVSKKNNIEECNNYVKLNNIYKLNLQSLSIQIPFPKSNIKNISYYGESIALKDKDYIIKDIMITSDIQGLCFIK